MTAVLGGFGAAVIWAVGTAFSSRAARRIGPMLTLAWVMLVGLLVLACIVPFVGIRHLSLATIGWLVLGGAGNVGGLLVLYHALRIGQMGVVMPVTATEGGIAALISIVGGQPVTLLATIALAVTVVGVMMTAVTRQKGDSAEALVLSPGAVHTPRGHHDRRAAVWAMVAATSFGFSLYGTARAGNALPAVWAVMPPRVIGVLVLTIPLALRGRLRCHREAVPMVVVGGLCEVGGFLSYAVGARHNIAVAAVLATLTGAISVLFGRVLFKERLALTQLAGVVVVLAGVGTLSALSS